MFQGHSVLDVYQTSMKPLANLLTVDPKGSNRMVRYIDITRWSVEECCDLESDFKAYRFINFVKIFFVYAIIYN